MGRRDKMLIKSDAFFCCLNNIRVDMLDFLTHRISKDIKNNKNLKGKHHGLCFVIGNGPSLKEVDLSLLKGFDTITVNGFYLADSCLKSTYHVLVDPGYNDENCRTHIEKAKEKNPGLKFIVTKDIEKTVKTIINGEHEIIPISTRHCLAGENMDIDMGKEMTGSANVIPVAIECAMYLGYSTICLLGCDFSMYTKVKGKHFYDDIEETEKDKFDMVSNNVGNLIRCALVHKQHYCIEKKSKELQIKILNATQESLIDAYDFVNLEDVIEANNSKCNVKEESY